MLTEEKKYDPKMRHTENVLDDLKDGNRKVEEETRCENCGLYHIQTYHQCMIDNPPEESILKEAEGLVNGKRQWAYDTPINNCTRIGKIWGVILGTDPVPPETVGLMMCGLKIAREVHRHTRDNLVDLAGYAHVTQKCIEANEN